MIHVNTPINECHMRNAPLTPIEEPRYHQYLLLIKISPVIQFQLQTPAQEIWTYSWLNSIKSQITEHGAFRLEIKNKKKNLDVICINRLRMVMNHNHCKYFNLKTHTTHKIK